MNKNQVEILFSYEDFGSVEAKTIEASEDLISKTTVQALKAIEEQQAN